MNGRAILRLSPMALLAVLAACGGGGTKTVTVTQTVTAPKSTVAARIYFVRDGKVGPVARDVPDKDPQTLLDALFRGPTPAEKALGFTSQLTSSGVPPPREPTLREAQVVYTLSQGAPSRPVTYGGKRYTRSDFEEFTPAILVESPLPFTHVPSPIRATGTANTFEATFQYELKDAAGKILAKHFVTATSGNGVRGTFDVSIPFTVTRTQNGTLTVYEDSAATGERINEYAIPLTLSP